MVSITDQLTDVQNMQYRSEDVTFFNHKIEFVLKFEE